MQFSGKYIIGAPRQEVWLALNDEEILQKTIFGCQKITWISQNQLEIEVLVNLGVMEKSFIGYLELVNVQEAQQYTLKGKGRGGILGKVHASADIMLKDHLLDDNKRGTYLEFVAMGGGSGTIMKLGKKIIGSSAQKIIDNFFGRFAKAMKVEITVLDI